MTAYKIILINVIYFALYIPLLFCTTVKCVMSFSRKKNPRKTFTLLSCLNFSIDNDGDGIIDEDCIDENSKIMFIQ